MAKCGLTRQEYSPSVYFPCYSWNVDPFERYNTVNFIVGYGIAIICFYGTHQPTVQRYSSVPTFRDAIKYVNDYQISVFTSRFLSNVGKPGFYSRRSNLKELVKKIKIYWEKLMASGNMGLFIT